MIRLSRRRLHIEIPLRRFLLGTDLFYLDLTRADAELQRIETVSINFTLGYVF
jgi:hypothetical protein